jgi:hypothetical protein
MVNRIFDCPSGIRIIIKARKYDDDFKGEAYGFAILTPENYKNDIPDLDLTWIPVGQTQGFVEVLL